MNFKLKFILSIVVTQLLLACSKKTNDSDIILPDVSTPINVNLNLSDKDNDALTYNGGFRIINYEKLHILVSRKNATSYWAIACDCNANVHSSTFPVLNYQIDKGTLKDNVCGSEFDAITGSVIKSPASIALVSYKAILENGILRISK
jgi:hypothetical protein